MERICRTVHLPFAGITLFRFDGYYLSHLILIQTAPRGMSAAKIAKQIITPNCNFVAY